MPFAFYEFLFNKLRINLNIYDICNYEIDLDRIIRAFKVSH